MSTAVRTVPSPSGGGTSPALTDPEQLLADVGDRIRAERQARSWTLPQFSDRVGLCVRVLTGIESGSRRLTLMHLHAICHALGMTMPDLLSDGWVMPEQPVRRRALTPHQVQILRLLTDTVSLSRLGVMVGTSSQAVASRLSEAYRLLGVKHLPLDVRRAAAVRAAEELGVFGDDRPAMFDAA